MATMTLGQADEILTTLELPLMLDTFADTYDTVSTNAELCDTDATVSLASDNALSCSMECSGPRDLGLIGAPTPSGPTTAHNTRTGHAPNTAAGL